MRIINCILDYDTPFALVKFKFRIKKKKCVGKSRNIYSRK